MSTEQITSSSESVDELARDILGSQVDQAFETVDFEVKDTCAWVRIQVLKLGQLLELRGLQIGFHAQGLYFTAALAVISLASVISGISVLILALK